MCGPYTCPLPATLLVTPGTRWACPDCGTVYKLARRRDLYGPTSWWKPVSRLARILSG